VEAGAGRFEAVPFKGAEQLLGAVDGEITAEDHPCDEETDVAHAETSSSRHGDTQWLMKHKLLYICMSPDEHREGACQAITSVFALLGKRWSGLILVTLLDGPARFSQIVQLVPGVSERMLSERLSELASAGLITRQVDEGPPVNVFYRLTRRGEALRPALAELERWGNEHLFEPADIAPMRG